MNISLPLKAGIVITLLFALLLTGLLVYPSIRFPIAVADLESKDFEKAWSSYTYLAKSGEKGKKVLEEFCRKQARIGIYKLENNNRIKVNADESFDLEFQAQLKRLVFPFPSGSTDIRKTLASLDIELVNKGQNAFVITDRRKYGKYYNKPGNFLSESCSLRIYGLVREHFPSGCPVFRGGGLVFNADDVSINANEKATCSFPITYETTGGYPGIYSIEYFLPLKKNNLYLSAEFAIAILPK